MKMLEKLGRQDKPGAPWRARKAMEKAATSKQNTLKTTQAVEGVKDENLKEKLRDLQKKQIAAAGGPDGDWLVLVDRSASMEKSIEYRQACRSGAGAVRQGQGLPGVLRRRRR